MPGVMHICLEDENEGKMVTKRRNAAAGLNIDGSLADMFRGVRNQS